MKIFLFLIFASFFLAACGAGSGEGLDNNGKPISQNPPDQEEEEEEEEDTETGVTLNDLVTSIFNNSALGDQRCANCHSGGSPLGGMNLETVELAYANLVGANGDGVNANGNASFKRVNPGNPDESYIILKLEGDPRAGSQMPLVQPPKPLSSAQIQLVRDWIANGAPQSGTGVSPTRVSKVSNNEKENELQIHFSRKISVDTFSDEALQIYFVEKGEQWLASSDHYQYSFDGQTLLLSLSPPDVSLDGFILFLNAAQVSAVYDANGRLLDGDGDNLDGGAFRYEYQY